MHSDSFLQDITQLILHKTGIKIRLEDSANLWQKVSKRLQTLKLKDVEYLQLLSGSTRKSRAEWDNLISLITTGESYFFRDRGQIKLIREHILPDLVNKMLAQKKLNILSAGCSTGEEVYSLAIIIQENFPELANWDINLVGVDLNKEAISKALQGIYPEWSFRGVEPRYRSIYFHKQETGWQISDSIRRKVKFRECNLVEDDLSFFISGTLDLIICRNVFIYFDREKISLVLSKFIDLLRSGGYLITGHTELQEQDITPLVMHSYPESLVYQKPDDSVMPTIELNLPAVSISSPNFKELAQQKFNEGQYKETLTYLTNWLDLNPQDESAQLLLVRVYANQGQYKKAEEVCHQVLEQNHLAVAFLQILAQIAEEQGQKNEAKEYLRRAMLIDPNFIPCYLDLIDLHLADREYATAEKLLSVVKSMNSDSLKLHQTRIYTLENLMRNFTNLP